MNFFSQVSAQHGMLRAHQSVLPKWLTRLGAPGLFFIAVIDSSVIPLPLPGSTDLLLLWLVAHSGDPWLLTSMAISGSLVGGYTTWDVGRRGGEDALHRHVPARILKRVVAWGQTSSGARGLCSRHAFHRRFLCCHLRSLPVCWVVSRSRFLIVYGAARTLRYSLIAWLGVVYGRHVIQIWSGTLQRWSAPLLWVFGGLLVAGVCFGIWKTGGLRKSAHCGKP